MIDRPRPPSPPPSISVEVSSASAGGVRRRRCRCRRPAGLDLGRQVRVGELLGVAVTLGSSAVVDVVALSDVAVSELSSFPISCETPKRTPRTRTQPRRPHGRLCAGSEPCEQPCARRPFCPAGLISAAHAYIGSHEGASVATRLTARRDIRAGDGTTLTALKLHSSGRDVRESIPRRFPSDPNHNENQMKQQPRRRRPDPYERDARSGSQAALSAQARRMSLDDVERQSSVGGSAFGHRCLRTRFPHSQLASSPRSCRDSTTCPWSVLLGEAASPHDGPADARAESGGFSTGLPEAAPRATVFGRSIIRRAA
jgi:hypothetical protein